MKAINFARKHTVIRDREISIIMQAKRSLVFKDNEPWKKISSDSGFDITMGSYDGAESCEIVVCYILSKLQEITGIEFGLYRDDGLGISTASPKEIESIKKKVCQVFREENLRITIEANKRVVNFLDVTLDLSTQIYKPYIKPNNKIQYVNAKSNHPPAVLKNIPLGVNKRLSEISSNEDIFNKAAPVYQKALDDSGYKHQLHYH